MARLRAQGRLVELGARSSPWTDEEAGPAGGGRCAGSTERAAALVGRTEGWPVGLYLAALALQAGGRAGHRRVRFTGDDQFMADYLRSELFAQLPPERVAFLTRTSVLERMCGPLCDAILDATGSARVLEALEGGTCW